MNSDVSIECGHYYIPVPESSSHNESNREVEDGCIRVNHLMRALKADGRIFSTALLIDDYSNSTEFKVEPILDLYKRFEVEPDYYFLESGLAKNADKLIRMIPRKNLRSSSNRTTFMLRGTELMIHDLGKNELSRYERYVAEYNIINVDGPKMTPISRFRYDLNVDVEYRNGNTIKYACPLLVACWYLSRLGYDGFQTVPVQNSPDPKPFVSKKIINVLSNKYISVESSAMMILKSAGFDITNNVEYILY